jgi:hypothetical protein
LIAKRALMLGLLVFAHTAAARAQSGVYVAGNVFADLQRGSGESSAMAAGLDATVAGGGVRVGGFLAPRWSLELGVDAGATTDATLSLSPANPEITIGGGISPGVVVRPTVTVTIEERRRSRVTATSVLLGYHPPARGRLQAGFKGGISFLRSTSTVTSTIAYTLNDPVFAPIVQLPRPITNTSSSVVLNTAAIVGAELAVALSRRAALVPEMRAFGFSGRIFLRPGAALRWSF